MPTAIRLVISRKSLFLLLAIAALLGLGQWLSRSPAATPIRIGVLHSLTGTMSVSEAPLVDAVRLAVEEINASGGLLGRQVELVLADSRSDSTVAAAEAERLIVEEKVSALFACWTSACRKAVKPIVEKHRHLMFYPLQYEGMEASPNIIYTGSAPSQQIIPGTRWALDHFGKHVYLIGSDYIFPRTANRIIRDLVGVVGGKVLQERYVPLGADPSALITKDLRQQQPSVILNTLNGDSNKHFFRALHEAGLDRIPVMSFSVAEVELGAFISDAHPAHYATWSYFQSLPDDDNQRFVKAFQARFGKNRVTSDPIEAAYSGIRLWANAVREAASAAPEQVNPVIGRQTLPGPSGVVAVDASTRHLWKMVRIGKARADGQFDQIEASATTVRPAPFPAYRSIEAWRRLIAEFEAAAEPKP